MVNIIHNFHCRCLAMRSNKVLLDPCNEVIFESTFNHLMEKIGRKEFMDVRSGEVIGERLPNKVSAASAGINNNWAAEVKQADDAHNQGNDGH
jgi:hypothetical protein